MKKKLILIAASVSLAFAAFGAGAFAASKTKLFVDGKEVKTNVIEVDGSKYVPLRAVSEMLGAKVGYEPSTDTVNIFSASSEGKATEPKNINYTQLPVTLEQDQFKVTVTKVEQDSDSLRVYVSFQNDSPSDRYTMTGISSIVANGIKYEYDVNFNFERYNNKELNYARAKDPIKPKISDKTVLFFKPIKDIDKIDVNLRVHLEDLTIKDIKVDVKE